MSIKPCIAFVPVALMSACASTQNPPSQVMQVRAAPPQKQETAVATSIIPELRWKQGQSCTFEYNHNGKKAVRTEKATLVEGDRVVLNLSGDGRSVDLVVDRDRLQNGISIVDGQPLRFEPASKWIDYPMQPGSTWTDDKKVLGETFTSDSKGTWKVGGWEKVKVPAGEYRALKVVLNETFQGQTKAGRSFAGSGTFSYWIAPEVNCPVKLQYRNSFGDKGTRLLRSATMG